jgi:GH15 family glucan-1,4-alpha-glucosidase
MAEPTLALTREPVRIDGYAPIRDLAAIGDGRCAAIIALDGAIDWLSLPAFDSPSVFGALVDAKRGGSFLLQPVERFEAERAYVEDSNVLQTTFRTASGTVRVTDSMDLEAGQQLPWRELARRIEALDGRVELQWRVEPRVDYGRCSPGIDRHEGVPFATWDDHAIGLLAFDAGEPLISSGAIEGRFTLDAGSTALLALVHVTGSPRPVPSREEIELRIDGTVEHWRRRVAGLEYDGAYARAVHRSVLALQLLTHAPSGALTAAATCSLPERVGGSRNYDYRFAWVRDTSLALDAMLRMGLTVDAHRTYSWLLEAVGHTHPRLQPIYGLDGHPRIPDRKLDLHGYRGSKPVLVGNSAEGQLQLGNFGDFAQATYRYVAEGHALDPTTATRMAEVADLVCTIWRNDDAGIWEIQNRPYTSSKMACWLTLEHACELARADRIPRDHLDRWMAAQEEIRRYVEGRCWSERRQSYTFYAGGDDLDVAVLLVIRAGYRDAGHPRVLSTIDAIREELARGTLTFRYSGMSGEEGCFLACSFWIVEALARAGRSDEAREMMDELVEHANDVGLFSEEIDPDTLELLGNVPQALTHLALLGAAHALSR